MIVDNFHCNLEKCRKWILVLNMFLLVVVVK